MSEGTLTREKCGIPLIFFGWFWIPDRLYRLSTQRQIELLSESLKDDRYTRYSAVYVGRQVENKSTGVADEARS